MTLGIASSSADSRVPAGPSKSRNFILDYEIPWKGPMSLKSSNSFLGSPLKSLNRVLLIYRGSRKVQNAAYTCAVVVVLLTYHLVACCLSSPVTWVCGYFKVITSKPEERLNGSWKHWKRILECPKTSSWIFLCSLSLHFSGHFPVWCGLAGTRTSPIWILLELRMTMVLVTTGAIRRAKLQIVTTHKWTPSFLQARCPCCRPTNSVTAI